MQSMHGVQLESPAEALAQVERLLEETPRNKQFAKFVYHLEQRREVLKNEIRKGEGNALD